MSDKQAYTLKEVRAIKNAAYKKGRQKATQYNSKRAYKEGFDAGWNAHILNKESPHPTKSAGICAVWVEATAWPEGRHNEVHWRRVSDKRPLLIIGRNYQENIIAQFGKVYTPDELEWLDETGAAAGSGNEEAIKFVEWVRSYCPQIYNEWMHDGKQYTTAQLYDIFKQKNK